MANISLTDSAGLTAVLQIRDDSPLAKAGLTQIVSTVTAFVGNINRAVGETDLRTIVFGATFNAPSQLIANAASLTIKGAAAGSLTIFKPADGALFEDDPFAPAIAIASGECWVEVAVDASLDGKLGAAVDGFGVAVGASASVSLASYTRVSASATLLEAIQAALENYTVACTAAVIRNQPAGTVTAVDAGGTLTFTGSYALPISVNALASADLPFNERIEVNPAMTIEVAGQIGVTGEFIVRCYRPSDTELRLGVYKKKGTTLAVSLSAGAGVEADLGKTDLLSAVMGAAIPGVDPEKAGITGPTADCLKRVLKDGIDRSLSIALNATCSAAFTHEAAVVYSMDLAAGASAATDAAIAAALRGDWTHLDALPNARVLRNIVANTKEQRHKIAISLLGIYNASSVEDFVQSCTILHDENGHIVITDRAKASRIAVASTPILADADRLRAALAEAFVATVTYTAAGAKWNANLSVAQTYFRYKNEMARQEMTDAILLARALGFSPAIPPAAVYRHVRIAASVRYDNAAALRLFFIDPPTRTPHTRDELVRIGREAMRALIDAGDPAGGVRLAVLLNDAAWRAMDDVGNTALFGSIPELSGLAPTELAAVETDWVDVAWWADSMVQVAPRLAELLSADASDPGFISKRKKLADVLASVTRNTHAAFVGGWGLAVMFALSGASASATVDISTAADPAPTAQAHGAI